MPIKDPVARAEYKRRWYLENREAALARISARYAATRDYQLEYRRSYYLENKDKYRAWASAWLARNIEKVREQQRKRYAESIEEQRARSREKSQRFKERLALTSKRWKKSERGKASSRRYYQANTAAFRARWHTYRARLRQCDGSHTAEDVKRLWQQQKGRCAVPGCLSPISDRGKHKYHVDHVVPISRGGSNDPSNLQILCATHNLEKNARDPYEWAQAKLGRLFL